MYVFFVATVIMVSYGTALFISALATLPFSGADCCLFNLAYLPAQPSSS